MLFTRSFNLQSFDYHDQPLLKSLGSFKISSGASGSRSPYICDASLPLTFGPQFIWLENVFTLPWFIPFNKAGRFREFLAGNMNVIHNGIYAKLMADSSARRCGDPARYGTEIFMAASEIYSRYSPHSTASNS